MMTSYSAVISLVMFFFAVSASGDTLAQPAQKMEDQLEAAFLKEGVVYATQRTGIVNDKKNTALVKIQLYRVAAPRKSGESRTSSCFEIKDRDRVLSPANFLRWRFTSSNYLWGTECSLDDHATGIFRVPLGIMKPIGSDKPTSNEKEEVWGGLCNFLGGK